MRFQSPELLLLLGLLPLLFVWLRKRDSLPTLLYPATPSEESKGEKASPLKLRQLIGSSFSPLIKTLAIGLLIISLARPQSVERSSERKANGIDIVMVLDVSLSMLIQDMGDSTRMDIAKKTFKEFIEGRNHDRIGFVIFSGEPMTLAPPTLDYGVLFAALNPVRPGAFSLRDGTAIGDGLALAVNRLKRSKAKSRVIILLTDGDNNVGRIDPNTAGELAQGYSIKVYSIAIGTEGRVKQPIPQQTPMGTVYQYYWVENRLNTGLLETISQKTGGRFYRVTDEGALSKVFQEIDQLEKTEVEKKEHLQYLEEFFPFLLTGLVLLLSDRLFRVMIRREWA